MSGNSVDICDFPHPSILQHCQDLQVGFKCSNVRQADSLSYTDEELLEFGLLDTLLIQTL